GNGVLCRLRGGGEYGRLQVPRHGRYATKFPASGRCLRGNRGGRRSIHGFRATTARLRPPAFRRGPRRWRRARSCRGSRRRIRLRDRKSTRLNSSHVKNSYAVFCLKKKK